MKPYEIIANQVIDKLETGVVPWQADWHSRRPQNLVSGHKYRGINVILTSMQGYNSPYWLTFRQASQLSGTVRAKERATKICFWKFLERELDDKIETIPLLRYYSVFNLEQCELPAEAIDKYVELVEKIDFDPVSQAEKILENMPNRPDFDHAGDQPKYSPVLDKVTVPEPETFYSVPAYYSSTFHEFIHSTGHTKRLNRFDANGQDYDQPGGYGKEELIAEIGSAILCRESGLETTFDQSASYISGWLKKLNDDKRLIISAGSKADKAVSHILGDDVNH